MKKLVSLMVFILAMLVIIQARDKNFGISSLKKLDIIIKLFEKKIEVKPTEKKTVWVEGKTLGDCMNGSKLMNNNTVRCHEGYFKEVN